MTAATLSWDEFEKVDIRIGTILEAAPFPEVRKPAYKLQIDFGIEIGIRKSSAQITAHYKPEELVGRQIVAVVNFPPKQIANFFSECLVLAIYDDQKQVVLLQPHKEVSNGSKIG